MSKYQQSDLKPKHNAVLPNKTTAAGGLSNSIVISETMNMVKSYRGGSQMTKQESNRVRETTSEKLCHLFDRLKCGEKFVLSGKHELYDLIS